MKVFFSWSGARSKHVATSLGEWLPYILPDVRPWVSDRDIPKGSRPLEEIAQALDGAGAGVICLTADNKDGAPWLLFEAGALSRSIADAKTHVCTYLLDLENTDVSGPLAQFQHTKATREDTLKLVQTMNVASGSRVDAHRLPKLIEHFWPDLERALVATPALGADARKPERTDRELLEEILTLARSTAAMGPASGGVPKLDLARWNATRHTHPISTVRVYAAIQHAGEAEASLTCGYCEQTFPFAFPLQEELSKGLRAGLGVTHFLVCPVRPQGRAVMLMVLPEGGTTNYYVFWPELLKLLPTSEVKDLSMDWARSH
jgi:hypothetical protein